MSVKVVKVQTTEYRIIVKKDDPDLAREYAISALESAVASEASKVLSEQARDVSIAGAEISSSMAGDAVLSAETAIAQAQIATDKATQANDSEIIATQQAEISIEKAGEAIQSANDSAQSAADALVSKNESVESASNSENSASASNTSANNSELAKGLSEAAKEIAIEEAGKSSTSAGQSAASAAAAEAAKNQILNKAEVNVTTAGNILRSDGAKFKSIPEVELLKSTTPFDKSYLAGYISPQTIYAWDNFARANGNPVSSENGIPYVVTNALINGNKLVSTSTGFGIILPYGFGGFEVDINFSLSGQVGGFFPSIGFQIYKDAQNFINFNFVTQFLRTSKTVDGVLTILQNSNDLTPYLGANGNNFKLWAKLVFNPNNRTFIVYVKIPSNQNILTINLSADAQITAMFPTKESILIAINGNSASFAETGTSINSYMIKY